MEDFIKIIGAVVSNPVAQAILSAAAAFVVAWFRARTAIEEAKIKGAVQTVEALSSPARLMSGAEKKAMAIRMVASKPTPSQTAKLGEKVERLLPEALDASDRATRPD